LYTVSGPHKKTALFSNNGKGRKTKAKKLQQQKRRKKMDDANKKITEFLYNTAYVFLFITK
jgi:hypothetical protein